MTTLGNDFSVTVKGDFTEEGGALSPTLGLFVAMIAVLATMRCLLDVYAPIKESVREALKGLLLQMLHSGSPAYPYGLKIYCFVCETIFGLVDYTDEDDQLVWELPNKAQEFTKGLRKTQTTKVSQITGEDSPNLRQRKRHRHRSFQPY